jgi:hypothetical protein
VDEYNTEREAEKLYQIQLARLQQDLQQELNRSATLTPAESNKDSRTKQVGGDHYLNLGIQPWDAMESWMSSDQFQGFLLGNILKYVARYRQKNGIEDLRKAKHYLEKLIEVTDATKLP